MYHLSTGSFKSKIKASQQHWSVLKPQGESVPSLSHWIIDGCVLAGSFHGAYICVHTSCFIRTLVLWISGRSLQCDLILTNDTYNDPVSTSAHILTYWGSGHRSRGGGHDSARNHTFRFLTKSTSNGGQRETQDALRMACGDVDNALLWDGPCGGWDAGEMREAEGHRCQPSENVLPGDGFVGSRRQELTENPICLLHQRGVYLVWEDPLHCLSRLFLPSLVESSCHLAGLTLEREEGASPWGPGLPHPFIILGLALSLGKLRESRQRACENPASSI